MRGDASRRTVLESAVDLASLEGLDQISIGRIADAACVSKSGVATLFGSKERLQLAAVEAARQRYLDAVVAPARERPRGLERLVALFGHWLAYSRDRVFPGGCFFASASADFDTKPGEVRDAIARAMQDWSDYLGAQLRAAAEAGEVDAAAGTPDGVEQFVFECTALLETANSRSLLTGSDEPYACARRGLVSRLLAVGADPRIVAPLADA